MAGLIQQSIVVSPGCCIMLADAVTMLMAGEVVRPGMFTAKDIANKLESGFLRYVRNDQIENRPDNRPAAATGNPIPGNVTANPLQGAKKDSDGTMTIDRDGSIVSADESVPNLTPVNPNVSPEQPLIVNRKQTDEAADPSKIELTGTWNFDPGVLASKDLQSLNLLAGERQPGIQPFASVEDAIVQMSSEFRPGK